ncbi:sensor histidine kinase [Elizabethkingia anophelis]|uniref:sensor histidine kinase n=1 Tax=Elizabethkingia anophelis TaxID=1117645 RepID=UPI00301D5167
MKEDPIKAWEYLTKAKEYVGADQYLNAKAIFVEAQILFDTNPQKAKENFMQADRLLIPIQSKEAFLLRARIWNSFTRLERRKDNYKRIFSVLTEKVIPLAKASGDSTYLAESYAAVGHVLMDHEQYNKAAKYYENALEMLRSRPQNGLLKLSVKISYCQNLLRAKELIKAKLILDEIRDKIPSNTLLAVRFGLNEGIYYNEIKQYKLAFQKLSEAKSLVGKLNDNQLKDAITYYQAIALKQMRKYEEAKKLESEMPKTPQIVYNKLALYQNNAESYFQQKKYDSAYFYLEKFSLLKDSIYNRRLKNEINAMEIKFRSEENQRKIAELKTSNQDAAFKVRQSKLYIGLFGISTILFSALAVLLYMYLQKNIHRERASVTKALLKGQEEERKRIARDLHDDLGGTLASVKMRFSGFVNENNIAANDSIKKIVEQLDNSSAKIRQIANNMMPEMLIKLGLEASLKDLCSYYHSDGLNINLNYLRVSETLKEPDKLTIYRIIQELLTNTVKHAGAKNVLIQCSQSGTTIFLTFEDDGRGLFQNKTESSAGLGLENIKARVAFMNGHLDIISGEGHIGTAFNIELNISYEI